MTPLVLTPLELDYLIHLAGGDAAYSSRPGGGSLTAEGLLSLRAKLEAARTAPDAAP